MRVSIVINNHNYGRFVAQAIDSALAQTHPNVEVIVCDDASTDDSWAVISRYADRVQCVRLPDNGGQAAAMNAGFALATGELVLFLDSDDQLDATAVATCVRLFAPDVAKVQYRLQCVDGEGQPTGRLIPHLMHDGDLRPMVHRFGTYAGPPSSGNCYRRSAIERYFPLAPGDWRRAADTPPFILSVFNGRVVNAPQPLGSYRVHSAANQARGHLGNIPTRYADTLAVDVHRRTAALAILAATDGVAVMGPFLPTPWNVRTRAMSWRIEPERHPHPEDTPWRLWRLQREALRACPGYPPLAYALSRGWLLMMLITPTVLARRVAAVNASVRARRWATRHLRLRPDPRRA